MRSFNFTTGGKLAVERILTAYGFTKQIELANYLGIPKSTLANRVLRDSFPSEWIIRCSIETGVSLYWLTTGEGFPTKTEQQKKLPNIDCKILNNGILSDNEPIQLDSKFLPIAIRCPEIIIDGLVRYVIERNFEDTSNGLWLVNIEDEISIKQLDKIPIKRLRVTSPDSSQAFECGIDDIKILGKVVLTCK